MNMVTKSAIFKAHLNEWLGCQGDRKKRGEMTKEISKIAKIHKKSVPRSFKRIQLKDNYIKEKRGRKTYYDSDVIAALFEIWEAANRPCGELLHPMINEYVSGFKQIGKWKYEKETTEKLFSMSLSTVKRKSKSLREKHGINKGKSLTKPSDLKQIIPIFKGPWDNLLPGNGQLDTVAHCGNTLLGNFAYTLSFIDAPTYWGIRRAQANKGQEATKNNLIVVKKRLPFPWLMGHPDTGSEFINWIAKNWCDENDIKLTRSEPGKKNDNMYVEERNGHVVRKYLGYQRLDARGVVDLMNEYYESLDIYLNHFQAVRRTLSKERIGAKYHRTFEKIAKTPYQRFMEHSAISDENKRQMKIIHESLNPLLVKEKLDKLKKKVFEFQKIGNQTAEL